jgi:protein-arginine kinase activator protein McsA
VRAWGVAPANRGLSRRAAYHFCQVEPRLATIQHMGRKDKGREICINCGQTFHKKLTSKELRCTKCRKAEKKAA